jgi:hypothetical protein
LCWWEDDGQDDDDADKVRGGPNHDYSLSSARENFKKYTTMYDPGEAFFERDDRKREIKHEIMRLYQQVSAFDNRTDATALVVAISALLEQLREMKKAD